MTIQATAPPILLHGWAMHGGIFAPLVQALREHHTLHVVDLLGHGHSRDCGCAQLGACAGGDGCGASCTVVWLVARGLLALHAAATQIGACAGTGDAVRHPPKFVLSDTLATRHGA
ncbi:MAG: hypothetical protein U1F19_08435 [Lysobacterales bacterium]